MALLCASVGVAVAWYPVAARASRANLSHKALLSPAYQIVGIILCLGGLMAARCRKRPVLVPEELSEDEVRTVTHWIQDFEKHKSTKRPQPKSAFIGLVRRNSVSDQHRLHLLPKSARADDGLKR